MAITNVTLPELTYIFGILGNVVSFGVFLSPMPTFWRIYKKKSTEGFEALPYSVALFSAMILLYYAMLKTDNATFLITINLFGVVIEVFYLSVFLFYAPRIARIYTFKLLGLFNIASFGVIILATMTFAHGSDAHNIFSKGGGREKAVGWICAAFSVCVFAAPLSVVRMVIRTKSAEFLPIWLSFFLTLCAVMWFFYGFLIKDLFIALPNVLGFLLGITQMILYIIYKGSSKKGQKNIFTKDPDVKELQVEFAVDIKVDNNARPQVLEIIVHEMEMQETCDEEGIIKNNKKNENNVCEENESVNVGSVNLTKGDNVSRGESNV